MPQRFRGEKRLINPREDLRGHAGPGIADAEADREARGEEDRARAPGRGHRDGLQTHDETPPVPRMAYSALAVKFIMI